MINSSRPDLLIQPIPHIHGWEKLGETSLEHAKTFAGKAPAYPNCAIIMDRTRKRIDTKSNLSLCTAVASSYLFG